MTKISVIIPCYNSFKFMNRCLISLQNQKFKDFEVIFIDDCSTDTTYKDLEKYLSKTNLKWTLIKNEINSGPGVSRNNGIEVAKGKFISFMDSDDWYQDDFLDIMYGNAIEHNSEIVMCDYYRQYSNGKQKEMKPTIGFYKNMTKAEFLAKSFDSLCCMLIERKLFDGIKMPSQFNAEDVAIIPVLIWKSKNLSYVSRPLYNYFYREGSLSTNTNKNNKIEESMIIAYKYICKNISSDFKEEIEFIGIKNILYGSIVYALQSKKSKNEINKIISDFEQNHPYWYNNKYINSLSKAKKIFIKFVMKRNYYFLHLLNKVRTFMFKFKIA